MFRFHYINILFLPFLIVANMCPMDEDDTITLDDFYVLACNQLNKQRWKEIFALKKKIAAADKSDQKLELLREYLSSCEKLKNPIKASLIIDNKRVPYAYRPTASQRELINKMRISIKETLIIDAS